MSPAPQSHSDILQYFGCLDELIQVIYQGFHRFIVLSNVDGQNWTVHLALLGPEGRWWSGVWNSDHILKAKLSTKLLDTFAQRVSESFVKGEICVGNWSADERAEIELILGPTSKQPLRIPLVELTPQEAASYAAKVFLDIALQSQSHGCRLNAPSALPPPRVVQSSPSASTVSSGSKEQEEIKALKAELAKEKKTRKSPSEPPSKPVVSRPPKGASLANPNKKARKYQALEFESDHE